MRSRPSYFFNNNGVKGNTWWLRDQIRAGQALSSEGVNDYVIDYGFNLLRRHFDDARVYSKLIEQDVSKEYLENTLGMYRCENFILTFETVWYSL